MLMVTIRTFTNEGEACFMASLLESNGFDAVLLDQGSFQWNYSGTAIPIRLQLPDDQIEAASAFIKDLEERKQDSPSNSPESEPPTA